MAYGKSYVGGKHGIVNVVWNVLWPCRSCKNVKHVIQGHCGHQRPAGPDITASASSSGAAMSLQKLIASSTAICGARARDLSQAPRQSGAPAPGQAGQAPARKFLELSQG